MLKKPFLFFLLFALLLPWSFAYASLEINEIMYDLKTGSDEGREWVEIYNNGDVAVDVSKFRFFEGDTNHKIKLVQGDPSLVPKGYSVIAVDPVKFKLDFSNFAGNLFDSSFSLSNDGETLAIKDENFKIIDQFVYNSGFGGAGDGNSLQKINKNGSFVWLGLAPTPGAENKFYIAPIVPKNTTIIQKKLTTAPTAEKSPDQVPFNDLKNDSLNVRESSESEHFYFVVAVFVTFLCTAACVVYFVRKKGRITKIGDDFDILES